MIFHQKFVFEGGKPYVKVKNIHKTCVFIAIVVVGLSGGRFSDEKGCCLSSKTREKNVCRGRMIELSTEMARVAEVDRGILWDEEGN